MPPMLRLYYCCSPVGLKNVCTKLGFPRNCWMLVFFMQLNLMLSLTPKECSTTPLKASKMRRAAPLVERRMSLPSLLNLIPVHSQVRSYWSLKVAKGPCWQVSPTDLHLATQVTCIYAALFINISQQVHDLKIAVFSGQQLELILEILKYLSLKHPSYLVKRPQIIKFNHFWIDSSSKNETFWVKGTHRLPLKVH